MQITVPDSVGSKAKGLALMLFGALLALVFTGHVHVPIPHFEPVKPVVPPPPPTPPTPPAPAPKPDWFGLSYPEGAREAIAAMPKLRQSAPHLLAARARDAVGDTKPILLYKAWTDLFADYPPYPAQQIGDCVSFGHSHANDLLQCIEWVLDHGPRGPAPTPKDIQETDTEFIYGASREIGGMLGPFDGSYGGAAVKAMKEIGIVSRRMMGSDGQYSGRRAKQFGRSGPPADWKAKAASYKLGDYAQVTTWDELVAALHNGNPVTICSGQGFTMTRDEQGFCRARGHWGHCMFVAGVRFDREGACIVQSWGVDTPSGPRALDQPSYSFWADRKAIEGILSEGDSWALSKSPHFGASQADGAPARRRRLPAHWRRSGPPRAAA